MMTDQVKEKVPDVSGEDILRISDAEHTKVVEKIGRWRDGTPCSCCGSTEWSVSPVIYTHTTFSITENIHKFNRVRGYFIVECGDCGMETNHGIHQFELRTKGSFKSFPVAKSQDD